MATGTKTKFVIGTISWIEKTGSFLINQDSTSSMWLSAPFIEQVYSNLGLSTETSFQLLKGCMIQCYKLEITQAMLDAGNGKHTVVSNLGKNREITFTTTGTKFIDHSVLSNSAMLDNAIMATGVKFNNSWAKRTPAVAANPVVANVPAPEPPAAEDDGGDHVDLDNEAGEQPGEQPGAEAPPVNAENA